MQNRIVKMGKTLSKSQMKSLSHCTLWKADRSPACRAVMMALDAMNLSITEVDVDMDKAEHRVPEMVVMNPLQTLPVFKDKELILCDSHAIVTYIAGRYGCPERVLPQDPAGRALVDQLLHYDSGIIYPRYRAAADPILYENCRYVMPQQYNNIENSYVDLENMLVGRQWLSGSWVTLGDIAIAANISTLNMLVPVDEAKFPLLSSWLYKMGESTFYTTANTKGLCEFGRRIDCGIVCDSSEFKTCPRSSLTRRSLMGGKLSEK